MSVDYQHYPIKEYLNQLASRNPVPGGGSAAALTSALGAALISMVAQYSIGRKSNTASVETKLKKTLQASEAIRLRLLELTSLDSKAYLEIVAARSKDQKSQRAAARNARAVGNEVCKLSLKAMDLTSFLVDKGSPYLISDIEVAIELLHAGFQGAKVMVRINQ